MYLRQCEKKRNELMQDEGVQEIIRKKQQKEQAKRKRETGDNVIVIRNSNFPDQNSVNSHVYSSDSPAEELIKLGVANIDSGLTGFTL